MARFMQKEIVFWCILVIATSITLGYYTGPSGYILPLVVGAMIITDLIKGRAIPIVNKFKSLTVQFLVGFIAYTSFLMLVSYVLGFIFLR